MSRLLNQTATTGSPRPGNVQRSMTTWKRVAGAQIALALLQAILVLATPFAWFRFYGYDAFGLKDSTMWVLAVVIVITALAVAWTGYMWGWNASNMAPARNAWLSLVIGALDWIWFIWAVLEVRNRIDYWSTFATGRYYWWPGTASYAVLVGALAFTAIGCAAVWLTRPSEPWSPSPSAPSAPQSGSRQPGWQAPLPPQSLGGSPGPQVSGQGWSPSPEPGQAPAYSPPPTYSPPSGGAPFAPIQAAPTEVRPGIVSEPRRRTSGDTGEHEPRPDQ